MDLRSWCLAALRLLARAPRLMTARPIGGRRRVSSPARFPGLRGLQSESFTSTSSVPSRTVRFAHGHWTSRQRLGSCSGKKQNKCVCVCD
eukprot:4381127-Alexandrium_andersonii.AAC.1